MLTITVPGKEFFDERTNAFVEIKPAVLQLEHSLVSISKWESKWEKPFLSNQGLTMAETVDYVRCMTLTQHVDPYVYLALSKENLEEVRGYIDRKMSATWFSKEQNHSRSREVITSELIYYWMIAFNVPPEYQKWHLNRLLILLKICAIKSQPPKKMSKRDIMSRNRSLNAARRQAMNSKG